VKSKKVSESISPIFSDSDFSISHSRAEVAEPLASKSPLKATIRTGLFKESKES